MIADTLPSGFRPAQIAGALRIQSERHILLADQPGSGKTLQALLGLEMDGAFVRDSAILIMCNVTACQLTWAPEIQKRIASQYEVVIADLTDTHGNKTMPSIAKRDDLLASKLADAQDAFLPLIVIANFDLVRWPFGGVPSMPTLFEIQWDAVIIDESHLVLPTKADAGKDMTQFWYGLAQLQYNVGDIRLAMSGTPDRGKLDNRYGTWKWLAPSDHTSHWSWVQSNFHVTWEQVGYNPKLRKPIQVPVIGKPKSQEQWDWYSHQHMIRRTKAEMLTGLPEKLWANEGGVDLPMTPDQSKAYFRYLDEIEKEEAALTEAGEENKASALKLQFRLRARQMATCTWQFNTVENADGSTSTHGVPIVAGPDKSNKLAWLLDWLEARGYTPDNFDATLGKVVIVSYFTEVLDWLRKELEAVSIHAEVLAGPTSAPDKKRIEHAFQVENLRVVLLSGHLGVSINLDAADDLIFMDLIHDPDMMEQAEDRIHRASRNHQCMYWRLVSENTFDMAVMQIIDHRYWTTRASYDGARGVQFARRMLAA